MPTRWKVVRPDRQNSSVSAAGSSRTIGPPMPKAFQNVGQGKRNGAVVKRHAGLAYRLNVVHEVVKYAAPPLG